MHTFLETTRLHGSPSSLQGFYSPYKAVVTTTISHINLTEIIEIPALYIKGISYLTSTD